MIADRKPKSWTEFSAWLRNLNLPNITIDHDFSTDSITIRNRATNKCQRISRFALEQIPDDVREEYFMQMVANTMKSPMEIVEEQIVDSLQTAAADAINRATPYGSKVTQAVYTGGTGIVSSGIFNPIVGGGGGGGYSISSSGTGAPLDKFEIGRAHV
mgnify:CR=1 FL=1